MLYGGNNNRNNEEKKKNRINKRKKGSKKIESHPKKINLPSVNGATENSKNEASIEPFVLRHNRFEGMKKC